jgi:hypothetical protein
MPIGGNYASYTTPPSLPSTAKVGDVFVVGTLNEYTNSTKTTSTGRDDTTLVMEADTPTTAIANLITNSYNASGTLTSTSQARYTVAADGLLRPISVDILYSNGTRIIGN